MDTMNHDTAFSRVRVRKELLPLMETFNGRIVEALSRTASMLQTDSSALRLQAEELLREASIDNNNGSESLRVDVLAAAHGSVRRRALRLWIARARGDVRRLGLVHLLAVEKLVFGERGGRIAELPGGGCVKRSHAQLIFHPDNVVARQFEKADTTKDT
jgi:tRNA(Ile)-lysidine synthase